MNTFIFINILFGLLGIYIAYKIKTNKALKQKGEKMVCLVGHKCDEVVFSDYSKFFGINLEIMGFIYYALIAVVYSIYFISPNVINETVMFAVLGITFGGFLFSIYLTYIQVFKLKSFCSWCLSSAVASATIFFSSYSMVLLAKPEIISYISSIQNFIRGFEFVSLILAIGIFTVLEITTFKFLKDFKITLKESHVLKTISQIGWFAFFLFILNNVGVYLPEKYLAGLKMTTSDSVFFFEISLIILIALNSMINQIQIIPEIQKRSLNPQTMPVQKISRLRKIATAQSILSLIMWYGLFYLNFVI